MNSWLAEAEMQAEWQGRFDYISEKYSAEFIPCGRCGQPTIDPVDHCQGDDEPGEPVTVAEAATMRIEGEPQGLTDDIPF